MSEQTHGPAELPDLTPKQRAFLEGILEGKTATDAVRSAYDCSNMTRNSMWVKAARLKTNDKVRLWLDAAKAVGSLKAGRTFDDYMGRLEAIYDRAMEAGQYNAALGAEKARAEALGLRTDEQNRPVTVVLRQFGSAEFGSPEADPQKRPISH